jgi:N-acetylglucosaminyldiphosphoundecaprenol N-acetyl-beta-D-mannosaminyltransferase
MQRLHSEERLFTSYTKKTNRPCWSLLGLPFDQVDPDQAVDIIDQAIKTKRKCFLSTPNLNFIVQAKSDESFYESVIYSDLVVADGMPVIWTAKLLGIPLQSRVAGSSLFEILQNKRRDKPISVFFFGGQGSAAEQAAENLNRHSVGMIACGALNPGMGSVESMSDKAIIDQINAAEPDFLVVALGAKKGQQWIMNNREKLNVSVISHLGAVVNFVGNNIQRAPLRWQKIGLEWVWRILQEPLLWKRYLIDGLWFLRLMLTKVLPLVIYQKILRKNTTKALTLKINNDVPGSNIELVLSGAATIENGRLLKSSCREILDQLAVSPSISINCSKMDYIDSSALGTLMLLKANIKRRGGDFGLFGTSPRINRLMRLHGVEEFLLEQ